MSEELFQERKRLRAEYFRLEEKLRKVKRELTHVENQLAQVVPLQPIQLSLGMEIVKPESLNIPEESSADIWKTLASEPVPDHVEVMFNKKPSSRYQVGGEGEEAGTGRLFAATLMELFQRTPDKVLASVMVEALRIKFPQRKVAQIRSQLHVVLKRMIDQNRISKIGRGVYILTPPEKTVAISRSGFSAYHKA